MPNKWFILFLGVLLLIQMPMPGLAVEEPGGEGEHAEEHGGNLGRIINFVIFAAILYYLLKRPFLDFLDRHVESVQQALERARASQEEATQRVEAYQAKLLAIEEEALKLKQEAEQDALREKEKLVAEAQASAERLMSQAKFEVNQEVKNAKEELKTFAALLAVEIAEKKIRTSLTESDQKRLAEGYMAKMENLN